MTDNGGTITFSSQSFHNNTENIQEFGHRINTGNKIGGAFEKAEQYASGSAGTSPDRLDKL